MRMLSFQERGRCNCAYTLALPPHHASSIVSGIGGHAVTLLSAQHVRAVQAQRPDEWGFGSPTQPSTCVRYRPSAQMSGGLEALPGAQHVRAVQAQRPDGEDVAVAGVRDGAITVEHAGDALLRPVAAGQLRTELCLRPQEAAEPNRPVLCVCWPLGRRRPGLAKSSQPGRLQEISFLTVTWWKEWPCTPRVMFKDISLSPAPARAAKLGRRRLAARGRGGGTRRI